MATFSSWLAAIMANSISLSPSDVAQSQSLNKQDLGEKN
jgi:hypothetical protein